MTSAAVLLLSRKRLAERPLHEWLPEVAADSVLVAPRQPAPPPGAFRAYVEVEDYRSWTVETAAEAAGRACGVELLASSSEDDVLRAARLRGRLGLAGQSVESAVAYRDKLVMKQLAARAGIAVPEFAAVDRPTDLLDFAAGHGLPVVIKPRLGAGAVGVRVLRGAAELTGWLASGELPAAPGRPGRWMVEACVDAPLHHVDGIAGAGRLLHCWPSRYGTGIAEAMATGRSIGGVMLDPTDPATARLQELAAQVVRALPAPPLPTSFHLEAWLPRIGPPVLCEIASRTSGGNVPDAYRGAFGVTLSRESLRGQCGLPLALTSQPAAPDGVWSYAVLAAGRGRFGPPESPCPVPEATIELRMAPGERADGIQYAGVGAAYSLVRAGTAAEAWAATEAVVAWWEEHSRWG